jgi:hypothetical protein
MDGSRSFTRRSILALAGALAVTVLAGVMALVINLGIFSSIGEPEGPGTLGARPAVHVFRDTAVHNHIRYAPARQGGVLSTPGETSGGHQHEMEHRYGAGNDD